MLTLVRGGMGGSETYARELTRQMRNSEAVDAWAVVPATSRGFSAGVPEMVAESVSTGPSTLARSRSLLQLIVRRNSLSTAAGSADVVHFPFTVAAPVPARSQAVVQSVLDVQHLDLPHLFTPAERAYRRFFYDGAMKKADAIITISGFAKERMVERLGIDPDVIHVAHLGVDADKFSPHLGPREKFLLYPARGWPHKNHHRLIQAVEIVRRHDPELRLVLTGGGLDVLGVLPEWVERRGLVPEKELRTLYRTAGAMVFPSLYEGFGLPPLEAMASGCPTSVSQVGSIPEVCGDAAALFDPYDPDSIADGILRSLQDSERLVQRGIEQAARFTWEHCAESHVSAYTAAHIRHVERRTA